MARLTLLLLGAFHAELDGQPVAGYKSNKVRGLLAYLAVEARRPHRRESLATLLWPDATDPIALTNLRNALADLRQLLHDRDATTPIVLINPDSIQLNPQADVWVDVWEYEGKGIRGREQGIRTRGQRPAINNLQSPIGNPQSAIIDPQSTITNLQSAIALYRGPFLEGFAIPDSAPFEEWITMKREQLGQWSIRILRRLADFHEACGEYEAASHYAQRQVELEPWLEEAHRQLMRIAALSGQRSAALAQYETCKRLLADELGIEPAVETTRLYQVILDGREDEIRGAELLPAPGSPPFKGLQYFDQADAPLFFGRQALTARLVEQVREMVSDGTAGAVGASRSDTPVGASRPTLQEPFHNTEGSPLSLPPGDAEGSPLPILAVVGSSGCGKSSLVRAGLVPALKQEGWLVDVITPTAHPMDVLQERGIGEQGSGNQRSESPGAGRILVVDQFEELFTLCRSDEERAEFLDCILTPSPTGDLLAHPLHRRAMFSIAASDGEDGDTNHRLGGVIITLRADFYDHCAQYPRLREALCARQEYIGPMTADELRQAIEQPAIRNGWELESGLVDLILRDAGASQGHPPEPGALPLLEHALLETWQRRRGRKLTLNRYAEAGGVHSAIAKTADSVFTQLSPDQQLLARQIFLRLTELGEGTQDTRRRAPLSELTSSALASTQVASLLKLLVDARLITLSENNAEVAHEALIREWPALREWLREDREGLRLHRRLTEQAQAWAKGSRDPGDLYRGSRLLQAVDWLQRPEHARELNTLEIEYLQASQELAARETTEREQRIQRELEAARRLSETEHQRALALQSSYARELASQAELKLGSDPELSLLLALQAVSEAQFTGGPLPWEVQQALHDAVADFRLLYTFSDPDEIPWGLAYSPDNKQFAYYSNPFYEAIIREAESGRLLHRFPNGCGWCGLAFSPDGKIFATGVNKNSVILWETSTWKPLLTLTGPVKDSFALAFSPDGRLLAVGNAADFTAAIWDLSSWLNAGSPPGAVLTDPILTLEHYGGVGNFKGVRFSPDGRWVGTVFQNTAILWDVLSGKELRTFTGHTSIVGDISFSPDGSRLATVSWDGSARVWDIFTGRELLRLTSYGGPAYSSDGSRLATSDNNKVVLWDPHNGRKLFELPGRGGVHDLVFSPDGIRLVSTHEDRYGRVWDASLLGRGELRVAPNQVNISGVICSPDRSCIASVEGRSIRILHAATFQEMQVLEVFKPISSDQDTIDGMAFSADNAMLAVAQGKNGVAIWNLDNGQLQCQFPFPDSAQTVAFSPTGRWLAVSGSYTRVVIYEGNENLTWREVERLEMPLTVQRSVRFALAFSPSSRWLAAGGSDINGECGGHIFIWQTNNHIVETSPIHIGEADARSINVLTFSPDSQVVASCGAEGLARLWDASTGKQIRQFTGHNATLTDIHFSPDGKFLATSSLDRTARVWDAADGKELLRYQLPDNVLGAYFTPDGQRVVVVPQTGGYHLNAFLNIDELVAVARARLTRDWQPDEIQKYLYGKKNSPLL